MKVDRQHLKLGLMSAVSLIGVASIMLLIKWGLMISGATISGSQIQIAWVEAKPIANSSNWDLRQVLWVYLFPYIGLFVIFLILSSRKFFRRITNTWFQLTYGWAYLVFLLVVFYMPLIEFLLERDLYHAFNWLHISSPFQIVIGLVLFLFFILKGFRVSQFFSVSLDIPEDIVSPSSIMGVLPFLWYIPILILGFLVYFVFGENNSNMYCFVLLGLFVNVFLNTFLVRKYDVIVK